MRINLFVATALLVAIFLCGCKTDSVTLSYTNAKGEVQQLGNLVFRFNHSLMPDSLLNNWDSTEYVSFAPRIKGRFRWEGPDQLVFSPSRPLLPATTYKASINKEALRYSKYDKVKDKELSFHTAPLLLTDAQVTWVLKEEGGRTALPQIQLKFNYPVLPQDIQEKLKIEVEGNPASFSILTASASEQVTVWLPSFKGEDKNYETSIVLGKGIIPQGGKNRTKEDIQVMLSIPSPFALALNRVESEHDGMEGVVRISTSQGLGSENIKQYIKFDPAVSYTVEPTDFGLILRSAKFDPENSYALTIGKGLRGKIGGLLKEAYNGSVAFGQLEADIKFTSTKGVYLSKGGGTNLEVQITNVPKIKVIISKVYENNLLMAQRYGYSPRDNSEAQTAAYDEDGYESYDESTAGDVVYAKEIDTRSLPKSGNGRMLNLSQFDDRLPEAKGIYHVMLRSANDYWVQDSRFISLSDIGLIARQGDEKMVVFANSIKKATALEEVTVNIYGSNNQLIGTGATNKEGVAEVNLAKREIAGFKPAMIVAKTGDDFTYLPLSSTRINTSKFDVGGKRNNATGLDAFVYAERDIYRPGEKINFAILVRNRQWKSPGEIPLHLKMLLPNGKEYKTFRRSLNVQGGTDGSVDIPAAALTGTYVLEVYTSTDVLLGTKNFMVEEFVPDRIRVTAGLNKPFLRPADVVQLSIKAVNFFGPPAANRNYETEIQVKQKIFSPKGYADFLFHLANEQGFSEKTVTEGKTDGAGQAVMDYEVPNLYANKGLLQATFYTTVFDETGRPVSKAASADIYTQDVFNGVKDDGFYYYPLNQPVRFTLVSLNGQGVPVTAPARVKIIKHEYRTVLVKNGGYFRYDSQQEDKVMTEGEVAIGNKTPYIYIPRSPGDYEIRIYRPHSNTYVSKSFYSYGSGGGENSAFEVNTEGHIDIEPDKQKYSTGEVAKLLFKAPFSGRMLVTIEREGLLSHQYVEVSKRTATVEVKLEGIHTPNVYITATLIKPHGLSSIPLTVAHGFQNITVEDKKRHLPVTITAQKSSRSNTRQKIRVKAAPDSYITLAAVDNGVLQVTGFKTPDPYGYYYQKKALEVTPYDLYPLLLPELGRGLSSSGGDGELEMEKRVNPMPAKRVRILSFWSGTKKTDGSGNAEFELVIPPFNGEIRVMAVAYKNEGFGSSEAIIKVADPLVISTALPRFLSPGDTAVVPVTITNTTTRLAKGEARLAITGPLKAVGAPAQALTIPPNSEGRVLFKVATTTAIGAGKINVQVHALEETFTEITELSVRPAVSVQKIAGSGVINGGTSHTISFSQNDFIPVTQDFELIISRSPVAELAAHLRYLVQYPYGCTEQVISAAFPQLYYGDMADALQIKRGAHLNANTNIMETIRKLKMRQLYNGALTLWDGEGTEDWWTTIYAAHFLLEARKAGFDVDNSLLQTMLGYLASRLKTKETIAYYYNRSQQRKIAPKEVAYSLYVLALANQAQVPAMNYYKATPNLLALDSRYLLSAAYAVAGDKRSFYSFLPSSFSGESSVQQSGGSLYSEARDEAIALSTLLDVDPANKQVPLMARHVGDRLKKERHLNTQERVFSFLALGKMAKTAAASTVTAQVKRNGQTIAVINGAEWRGNKETLKGGPIEVVTKGSGPLYYTWQAEGISRSGRYAEEDSYIKVRRRFFDRYGKEITNTTFRQNDLIIIGITLEKAYSNRIDNIVLTDMLPAGFEIENPRTKELPGMDWIKGAADPVSLDVRDDRIHFFVDAVAPKQIYYYAVRAVSLGHFKQGPVQGDAMYNGEIHSYHGAGTIKIIN